jgi:hypothetical protein
MRMVLEGNGRVLASNDCALEGNGDPVGSRWLRVGNHQSFGESVAGSWIPHWWARCRCATVRHTESLPALEHVGAQQPKWRASGYAFKAAAFLQRCPTMRDTKRATVRGNNAVIPPNQLKKATGLHNAQSLLRCQGRSGDWALLRMLSCHALFAILTVYSSSKDLIST